PSTRRGLLHIIGELFTALVVLFFGGFAMKANQNLRRSDVARTTTARVVTLESMETRRLCAAGELDHAFGSDGFATLDPLNGQWNDIVALAGGSFLAVGRKNGADLQEDNLIAARYDSKGKIDTS